jgi:hypothetical protein
MWTHETFMSVGGGEGRGVSYHSSPTLPLGAFAQQIPTSSQPMANKINERGQISGMATVLSGPHAGDIHAFLATPVEGSI